MNERVDDGRGHRPTPGQAAALVRDFTLETLAAVRHEVERYGAEHGLVDRDLYRFVVAVNELTTNAVRHGGGSGRLELRRAGRLLRCRISDHGPGIPTADDYTSLPASHAVNGRGLWLARQNTASLNIDSRSTGTVITLTARVA